MARLLTTEQMKESLEKKLNSKRYIHSIQVMETAIKLASIYHVDMEKAAIAGLLHDCAKHFDGIELLRLCDVFGFLVDEVCRIQPDLLHAPVGAHIARQEYKIEDEEILRAIECHTLGRIGMTMLEKVIFIADFIEPSRDFKGVKMMRKMALKNIDTAILMGLDETIQYVIKKKCLIHPATIHLRNAML